MGTWQTDAFGDGRHDGSRSICEQVYTHAPTQHIKSFHSSWTISGSRAFRAVTVVLARIFSLSYIIISSLLILNLFIGKLVWACPVLFATKTSMHPSAAASFL